jgi:cytochrome c biogenesis protein CcmG, thiol:disulfide interchange protein DsbE
VPGPDRPERRAGWVRRSIDIGLWVLVLGILLWRFGPQLGAAVGLRAGTEPAPDFVVETLDGESIRLSELRGQVVLVNFWATWCPPCRIEMPGFQRVWEDYRDQGFVIVGLSVDQGVRSDVVRWVGDRGLTFPIAFAPGSVVRSYGGASVLPTSILIDTEGRIAHRVQGYYAEPALRAAVRRLLP